MPVRVLDFGRLQTTSQTTKQSLYLACAITLDLPDSIPKHINPEELAGMTASGQLWIAKGDACRLEVRPSVELNDAEATSLEHLVDAAARCSIWEEMNLKLRKETSKLADEEAQDACAAFIINHHDLTSDYLSPNAIPCAKFLTITCEVHYGTRQSRSRPLKTEKATIKPERQRAQTPYALRAHPRPAKRLIEADTDDENGHGRTQTRKRTARPTTTPGALPPRNGKSSRTENKETSIQESEQLGADMATLATAAFSRLLGIKRLTPDTRLVKDLQGPSLVDLAPAVFNVRYLQAYGSRAEHVPWIASCLSRLDAESPSLRDKIRRLTEGSDGLEASAELRRRLHMLVTRVLVVAPVAVRSRGAVAVNDSQQPESQSQDNFARDDETYAHTALEPQDPGEMIDSYVSGHQPILSQFSLAQVRLDRWSRLDGDSRKSFAAQENRTSADAALQPEDPGAMRDSYVSRQQPSLSQSSLGQETLDPWSQHASGQDSQEQLSPETPGDEEPNDNIDFQPGIDQQWIDLSQASFVVDEHWRPVPLDFDDLDDDEYEYQLVPLE